MRFERWSNRVPKRLSIIWRLLFSFVITSSLKSPSRGQEITEKVTLERTIQVSDTHSATSAFFRYDGSWLYAAGSINIVKAWKLETKEEGFHLRAPFRQFVLTSDNRYLATAHGDVARPNAFTQVLTGFVRIWDAETSRLVRVLPTGCEEALSVAVTPDSKRIAVGGTDRKVRVWEFPSGRPIHTICPGPRNGVLSSEADDRVNVVQFSSDGKQLLTVTENYDFQRWDTTTGKELPLEGERRLIFSPTFSPDGKWIAASMSKPKLMPEGGKAPGGRFTFRIVKDGKVIGRGYEVHHIIFWDAETGKVVTEIPCEDGAFRILFHPDGKHLITANGHPSWGVPRDRIACWDLTTKKRLCTWTVPERMTYAAVCPTGRRLATCHEDGTVRVWRMPPLESTK